MAAARRVGPGGTVVVGLGGSATTDGGLGTLEAVEAGGGVAGVRVIGACDVGASFVEAAAVFGPQKGAGPDQVAVLTARLEALADRYADRYGVDVRRLPGAGAAGGLGGALAVLGGTLASGYELVRDLVGLDRALQGADRVVTGEGALDGTSFRGKVVGGVVADARRSGVPTLVVAGRCTDEGTALALDAGCAVVCLVDRFGHRRAQGQVETCIAEATADWLGPTGPPT